MAKMTLDDLTSQLRAAFGQELHAVVLYGSAATSEHVAGKSDYNVLVIVDSLAANRLGAASAAIKAWRDAGNPPPLTLTLDEWKGSTDIFPMEYADILERHRVLHGALPADVRVDREHLRLELEHEAMGTLLQLRRGALASGGDGKAQLVLLETSASTVMVVFRAVLRLHGEAPPSDSIALSQRVGVIAGMDAAAFVRLVKHRRGEQTLKSAEANAVLDSYLAGMQQLVSHLDRFAGKTR